MTMKLPRLEVIVPLIAFLLLVWYIGIIVHDKYELKRYNDMTGIERAMHIGD
jgi:hypothetical protein